MRAFADLAAAPDPPLDELALALAGEFRPVDAAGALATLDALGAEVAEAAARSARSAREQAQACAQVLGERHGFEGDRGRYDHPDNSMLDVVLERRRGLPILLSAVYVEVGRRAGLPLGGVGLPGHFVVGHFGVAPPLLLDPFERGAAIAGDLPAPLARRWSTFEIVMRMLNNLVAAFERRGDVAAAIRAAELRLALPAAAQQRETNELDLRRAQARLN